MKSIIKIDLEGKNKEAWERLSEKLITAIETMINNLSSAQPKTKKEAKQIISDVLQIGTDFAKAKLDTPRLENEERLARIAKIYRETEKVRAETDTIEIANAIKKIESLLYILQLKDSIFIKEGDEGHLVLNANILKFLK